MTNESHARGESGEGLEDQLFGLPLSSLIPIDSKSFPHTITQGCIFPALRNPEILESFFQKTLSWPHGYVHRCSTYFMFYSMFCCKWVLDSPSGYIGLPKWVYWTPHDRNTLTSPYPSTRDESDHGHAVPVQFLTAASIDAIAARWAVGRVA